MEMRSFKYKRLSCRRNIHLIVISKLNKLIDDFVAVQFEGKVFVASIGSPNEERTMTV